MAFDATKPASTTSLRSSNPQILANWVQLQTAINNEHIFSGTAAGTQTGDHDQGSARAYSEADPGPTTRIDGSGFLSTDLGSLWHSTTDDAFYILTATAPTWTPVSTEVITTLLASARTFLGTLDVTGAFAALAAATVGTTLGVAGAVTLDTTLEVTGVATIGDASLLKTSAAPSTDAMIANKKYVDDQITANVDTAYSGGESHTFGGGLIIKTGSVTGTSSPQTVTFGVAFPNAIVSVQVTTQRAAVTGAGVAVDSAATTGFDYYYNTSDEKIYWTAIGY